MAEKILYLTLKKEWFDKIKSGEKKEEYREKKPYYEHRFLHCSNWGCCCYGAVKRFDWICFRNGYGKRVPQIFVKWLGLAIRTDTGTGIKYFVIKLGEVKNVCMEKNIGNFQRGRDE